MSTYVAHELYGKRLETPRRLCSQARTIQEVLTYIDEVGYREHKKTGYFDCNYSLGERILLELYEELGFENFQAVWKDLYQLSNAQDRRLTEQEIHSSFMRHTPEAKVDQVEKIYASRHGGDFSEGLDDPSAPEETLGPIASSIYIPLLNAEVTGFRFFEAPRGSLPPDQRVYALEFEKSSTRYVRWELNLDYPEHGQEIEFEVEYVFYREDGSVLGRRTSERSIKEGWTGSYHSSSWGWERPGRWPLGSYLVELYIDEEIIASGEITITK